MLVALVGMSATIIGAISYTRNCYSPRQPSISIWLLVLGCMSIILVSVLTLLVSIIFFIIHISSRSFIKIILSTTCKYKSSDKKFRLAFIITIGIATSVLGWANAPEIKKMF